MAPDIFHENTDLETGVLIMEAELVLGSHEIISVAPGKQCFRGGSYTPQVLFQL